MKKLIFIIIMLNAYLAANAQEKFYNDKEHSVITYAMEHPLHSWTGTSHEVTSVILTDPQKEHITQVAVAAKVASFDSNNANRDSHMMESTEALLYPQITFKSNEVKEEGDSLLVSGILNFHGVDQPVSFKAKKKKVKDKVEVNGNFVVTMTQFNIDPPSLLGLATEDHIDVAFDVFY